VEGLVATPTILVGGGDATAGGISVLDFGLAGGGEAVLRTLPLLARAATEFVIVVVATDARLGAAAVLDEGGAVVVVGPTVAVVDLPGG
jgi:hypothetical protein